MKILLGTDIVLTLINKGESLDSIAVLLKWSSLIGATCYTDIPTIAILTHFAPISSFENLRFLSVFQGLKPKVQAISKLEKYLEGNLTKLNEVKPLFAQLNWLYYDADILVTDNPINHTLANLLQIGEKVYTTEEFVDKCYSENRDKDDSIGVAIKKVKFGYLDLKDTFFNDFKKDYSPYYEQWFKSKADDDVYIAVDRKNRLRGLLKLKYEDELEDYSDITPSLRPAKRLKICSFKAHFTAQKLGQRFMRIIFEHALAGSVDEIYVTVVANGSSKERLIRMIEQWGFSYHGDKGKEEVYVRDFRKGITNSASCSFPFQSSEKGVFVLPIYRSYANQLLPPIDVLNENDIDVEPTKQAIRKVVILHNDNIAIKEGSIILFFQKSESIDYRYIMGVGTVEHVYRDFNSEYQFVNRCKKRSTLLETSLHDCWLRADKHPVVVDFLYTYSFEEEDVSGYHLKQVGINVEELHSQCIMQISVDQFKSLIKDTKYEKTFVVD